MSADPSRDGLLTKKRDALCRCGALTLEEQKSVLPLCSQGLCNDRSSQRAKCHSVLAAFLLGHRVSWPPLRCFLGSGFFRALTTLGLSRFHRPIKKNHRYSVQELSQIHYIQEAAEVLAATEEHTAFHTHTARLMTL